MKSTMLSIWDIRPQCPCLQNIFNLLNDYYFSILFCLFKRTLTFQEWKHLEHSVKQSTLWLFWVHLAEKPLKSYIATESNCDNQSACNCLLCYLWILLLRGCTFMSCFTKSFIWGMVLYIVGYSMYYEHPSPQKIIVILIISLFICWINVVQRKCK